ncbi:MAG: retroviral-like aspartic protease family protein [Defluviitaleaceae bacterium]|nr:retroviral-like aspartic protease family protein [Defluviitaleaceae bacterium]
MGTIKYSHEGDFELIENKLVAVLGSINASERNRPVQELPLIVDTGAFITLINKDTAENHGYKIDNNKTIIITGFSEKGMICDLRKIPALVFCGFVIQDVLIATPQSHEVKVPEVLGMNILENFNFAFDMDEHLIYLNKRGEFVSDKPHYKSGEVVLLEEDKLWSTDKWTCP